MTFRELRELAGYAQISQLAAVSGLLESTISQLEKGNVRSPRFMTLQPLAEALDTPPAVVARAIEESWRETHEEVA